MESERKFLHEMSNPLAIGFGNIKILLSKLQKTQNDISAEYTIDKVSKALDALERVNRLIEERRRELKEEEANVR